MEYRFSNKKSFNFKKAKAQPALLTPVPLTTIKKLEKISFLCVTSSDLIGWKQVKKQKRAKQAITKQIAYLFKKLGLGVLFLLHLIENYVRLFWL